jgi:hypothetical protein
MEIFSLGIVYCPLSKKMHDVLEAGSISLQVQEKDMHYMEPLR